ncbi:DUF4391 domain-containing protein [Gemmata sp. G18]|uniref:DUF4391 domain-containing protein n=1 Tax=Gemmata palustris TaxID=2822762 RepID=A0ABS5BNK6_9BACT|nr:DUF4391 domain-containing protein [Gemmata palustris]MBP3955047.1 DUF4391 domain-containing protein [Gemmata palustris]
MNADRIVDALALPPQARVDQRVAKKHLLENGAPTATDKRLITDGIDELVWVAALKPSSVGVPAFRDASREYLEIAVLTLALRPAAKAARLRELVHRAIPYPQVLITTDGGAVTFSLAHLRHAENEAGKTVLDGGVVCVDVAEDASDTAFLNSLPLAALPKDDLFVVYQGWLDRMTALDAALLTGRFTLAPTCEAADARRHAVREIARLDAEIGTLRTQATKEPQLSRRVDLNLEVKRLTDERNRLAALLG